MSNLLPAIPLFSARLANASVDISQVLNRVVNSHWYVLGNEVAAFEDAFARYIGVPHCVSVANGTDALELALRALNVGPGDTVATVANAGFYSSTAIFAVGARPVYIDVDPDTLTLDPNALQRVVGQGLKALVVTHLYGRMADITALCAMAHQAGVPVIEDCAQAHGAALDGRRAGSFGDLACFSFYPTKNLGALGDGGAVVTRSAVLAARVRQLRQYGWGAKYHVELQGGRNSRLDELQAAVLREKLPHLDAANAQRREIAAHYTAAFAGLPLHCPDTRHTHHVAHLYVVRTAQRDALRAYLAGQGIASEIHYPVPDHQQPAIAGQFTTALPVTEQAATEILTLPCFPGLAQHDIARVIDAVQGFFKQ